MPTTRIQIGRNLSHHRISAYECKMKLSGEPVQGRYVTGWYGTFTIEGLQNEIMPKLVEYSSQGWSYPFLITYHQLENKANVHIAPPSGVKFSRRRRKSSQTRLAVVLSATRFKLLLSEPRV
ncbi:hypothetical protein ES703_78446 [subsurface metagenome]